MRSTLSTSTLPISTLASPAASAEAAPADADGIRAASPRRMALRAALLALAMLPSAASAMPLLAREYKQEYGYMPSCNACHSDGGGSTLNAYGKAFKAAGKNAGAFARIANLDSDGDGASNGSEAAARANPGDPRSTPAKPGEWLDIASLIPREVRAQFPGVRTWLPRDALLTPADMTAAKALGVTLNKDDENTIYIPLESQRPAGTALIFRATHQGKDFFLLMTTDRQLKIAQVQVLHANAVPQAKNSKVYGSFAGLPAQQVPAPSAKEAATLDGAIRLAVKRAGVLLYVRLKGA
ncbi:hypothetical protein [Amnimonas aquatica]|uniref:Cytochrome c domain-containing protein n=1 Tax=Amnimonas aquatica TaxID=2094561 RepID=A0A2P6ASP0_9GAMM|nr:hypothetical protein [Amnimonas aquatica]PQA43374.1 hypothetical protein C5O18_05310 [Amnimonas aquatica]